MGKTIRGFFSRLRLRVSTAYHSSPYSSSSMAGSNGGGGGGGMKLRSRSEENLNKLDECMDNMDEDVSQLLMEFQQTNLLEDPDLFLLLTDYFTISKAVSELCDYLRKCLLRDSDECLFIDEALRDFDKEKVLGSYGGGLLQDEASCFRKTVGDLRNFNAFYDKSDWDSDFLIKFQICHKELTTMIVKLEKTMKEIEKKLKRVRGRRAIVTMALLAPAIGVIFVCKYIAGSVPMEALTALVSSRWKKSTEALKREQTAMISIKTGTIVALCEVERISRLVSSLESVEKSIRVAAELAVKKRSSVADTMGGMEEKRNKLKSMLVDLDRQTGKCDRAVQFGRKVARERMAEFLSRGVKSFN